MVEMLVNKNLNDVLPLVYYKNSSCYAESVYVTPCGDRFIEEFA